MLRFKILALLSLISSFLEQMNGDRDVDLSKEVTKTLTIMALIAEKMPQSLRNEVARVIKKNYHKAMRGVKMDINMGCEIVIDFIGKGMSLCEVGGGLGELEKVGGLLEDLGCDVIEKTGYAGLDEGDRRLGVCREVGDCFMRALKIEGKKG